MNMNVLSYRSIILQGLIQLQQFDAHEYFTSNQVRIILYQNISITKIFMIIINQFTSLELFQYYFFPQKK